jgi:hypothetical protein
MDFGSRIYGAISTVPVALIEVQRQKDLALDLSSEFS